MPRFAIDAPTSWNQYSQAPVHVVAESAEEAVKRYLAVHCGYARGARFKKLDETKVEVSWQGSKFIYTCVSVG